MAGLLFSIVISVSLVTVVVFAARRKIVERYGFKVLYILSFILALRLIIPYSVQIPNVPQLNITIPLWVPVIWGIGVVVSLLFHTANYIYSRKQILRYGTVCSDEDILSLLSEEKRKLFIDRDIPLVISKEVGTPMLFGMLSPVIVLPFTPYTESEYRMIFRHELLHYRNKDSIKKLFFVFVVSVCWFNPFAYLLMRESSNSLECICDEGVLKNKDTQYKQDYCFMLLKAGTDKRFIPLTSSLNTKEMLKMRINSIFEKKNKKSGSMLIVSVVLCLSLLSSILCSCTVETPQDVIDEMNNIESGVGNEKDAQEGELNFELHPVSEVVSTAQQTIDEWNSKDGIFKFNNCIITLPDADEFVVYTYDYDVGIESAQQKQELFDSIEEKYFGKDYFTEEEMLYVPINAGYYTDDGGYHRIEYSREEFLKSDGKMNYVGGYTDGKSRFGSIQYMPLNINIETPYFEEYGTLSSGNVIIPSDNEALDKKVTLMDGSEVSLSDVVTQAEKFTNSLEFFVDEKLDFKVDHLEVPYGRKSVRVLIRPYCDGVPFVGIQTAEQNSQSVIGNIDAKFHSVYEYCDLLMMREGQFDFIWTTASHTVFTPTGESVKEIISVEQVLGILKDTFSNQTVYYVTEFALGNAFVSNEGEKPSVDLSYKNIPIYQITLNITGSTVRVWINARTGDMNYFIEN